jgi:integrase
MASIQKRGSGYRVRWIDHEGTHRSRHAPNVKTAKRLKREIEEATALGVAWRPGTDAASPTLNLLAEAYLDDRERTLKPSSLEQVRIALDLFLRMLAASSRSKRLGVDLLSRQQLADYFKHLTRERKCSKSTASTRIRMVHRWWSWAWDHEEHGEWIARPRELDLPRSSGPRLAPYAPSWAECDSAIERANGWYRHLFITLRGTGLRSHQAMHLLWSDVDLDQQLLTIRPELGKSQQERRGRVIPLAGWLVDELAGWGRRDGWLISAPPKRNVDDRTVKRYWASAACPVPQPQHAFRRAFISELTERRADDRAIKRLVGHAGGITLDVYTGPSALMEMMREAVDMITPIGQDRVVALRSIERS